MMKVVHIGFKYGLNNTGGAAIAATRLHQALLSSGVESHYVCVRQFEKGMNVHVLPTDGWRKLYFALTKLTRCVWKFTPYRKSIPLNVVPMFGLEKLLREIDPDVVHVQWINADVASFEQLGNLRKVIKSTCKIIFNLHDLNTLMAFDAHPKDNRYVNGFAVANSTRLERWVFGRKKRMIEMVDPVFVGPSEWVCECCRRSIVGRDHAAYAISNIIDPVFTFHRELCKQHDKFIILFGCFGGRKGNAYKGWDRLKEALNLLPEKVTQLTEVMIIGDDEPEELINRMPVRSLGRITDSRKLLEAYHRADIFAFPSNMETQGMTKIEAMLCGLPVVVFQQSACAEGVDHQQNGWVARGDDVQCFADGLIWWFEMWQKGSLLLLREEFSNRAARLYGAEFACHQIEGVYSNSLADDRSGANVT